MERWETLEKKPAPLFVDKYGPLSGMRVVANATITAAPFSTTLMGEMGAEIIQVERPNVGDPYRYQFPPVTNGDKSISAGWIQNARNRLSFTLNSNLNIPESKEIFLSLIKNADVWLENMVWLDKLGISDEMLLEVNPKLVICHVSGFGQNAFGGVPEVSAKPSYDIIGQAEGGWTQINGFPEPGPPHFAATFINDFMTAMFNCTGILSAYINVLKGGSGQVVDVSQCEAQSRVIDDVFSVWCNLGMLRERSGNKVPIFQPAAIYKSKDGRYIIPGAFGPAVYYRFIDAIGEDPNYFTYEGAGASREAVSSPLGQELEQKSKEFFESRNAEKAQEIMTKHKVPCGIAKTAEEIYKDPHWQGRNDFVKYVDQTLEKEVEAYGFVPKFSKTPQKVWRGAPKLGQDTEMILSQLLNYSENEINGLKGKNIID